MAIINYRDLKNGKILSAGDELEVHGIHYKVIGTTTRFFLENKSDLYNNSKVFTVLGLSKEQKCDWARKYHSTGNGDFPEFSSIEDLTKFTMAILEASPYKEGDIVIIHKLKSDEQESDYPWAFVHGMSKGYGGKQAKIRTITVDTFPCDKKHYNGDPHKYILEKMDGRLIEYTWHSSMFTLSQKASEESPEYERYSGDCGSPDDDRYDEPDYVDKECYQEESIEIHNPQIVGTKIIL